MKQQSRNYEPAIDGLRAVAILAVLFYHAGITGFPGGFVGVDIFFVISGYLITRNILSDLDLERFTFTDFYIRRARRIFPAMFFTMVCVGICGFFLFSPFHLERLGGSLFSSCFAASNFFFWQESGYWDAEKIYKPLLHFWSLAVEEQFYLFWPALLFGMAIFKKRNLGFWGIALLSLLSLCASEYYLSKDAQAVFYLMPFRIFEFGLGAILLWLEPLFSKKQVPGLIKNIAVVCALGVLVFVIGTLSESSPFPGLSALIPCIAASVLIFFRQSQVCRVLLANRTMVFIGLISYSLYLVHWPLFVFYKYTVPHTLEVTETVKLLVVSFILAVFMYACIEQPFRKKSGKKNRFFQPLYFFSIIVLLLLLLAGLSLHAWKNDGWSWRIHNREISYTADDIRLLKLETISIENTREQEKFFEQNPAKFIIIGDSYANDVLNALELNRPRHPVKRLHVWPGCLPLVGAPPLGIHTKVTTKKRVQRCVEDFQNILESDDVRSAEIIMLGANWYSYGIPRIAPTIDAIRKRTMAPIIIFGHKMIYDGDVPARVTQYGKLEGVEQFINSGMLKEESLALNEAIKKEVLAKGVLYVDMIDFFCPDLYCTIFTEGTKITIIDNGHWSMEGARIFGERFRDSKNAAAQIIFEYP